MYPEKLKIFYDKLEKLCREAGITAGKSGYHMKFPYTLSAKIAQFPYFYYMKHNNIWMYYPFGCLGAFYVFNIIHDLANSDANVRNWAETQRRLAEKEQHH